MDDNGGDSHLCLRCSSTITGLENYILHRKTHCAPTKQAPPELQVTSPSATHQYEPSSLRADDFFSSLELQSIQAVVTTSTAHKSAQADDDFDEADDSENELYPPRSHTGGKWKPGWRPDSSSWKSIQSPGKQSHGDRGKVDDSSFYCVVCGRSYRDRYSFKRHVTTPYHLKRSGEKRAPCKRSSRTRSSCKLSDIIDKLLDKRLPKEDVGRDSCRTRENKCPSSRASHVDNHQKIGSRESPAFTCRAEDHNSYVQCVSPAEVTGQACRPKEIQPVLEVDVPKNGDVCSGLLPCRAPSVHYCKSQKCPASKKDSEGLKDMYYQRERNETRPATSVPPLPQAGISGSRVVTSIVESCHRPTSQAAKVSCPYCSKLMNKLYLKFHLFTHTGERPYQCHMCGRTFSHRSTLSTHIKHHLGIKRYQCDQCAFCAVRPSMLRRHQRSVHNPELRRRTHLCHVCGLAYFDPQSLQRHVLRHDPSVFHFACKVSGCKKSVADLSRVKADSGVHKTDRNLLCDTCGYSTMSAHQLTKHKRKHTGERPFKCKHCNYRTSRCSQLRRHSRVHTGAKPYKCPYCDYQCNSQENMRKHILKTKKHAGKKMYMCSECAFSSNEFSTYKGHLHNEHGTHWPSSVSPLAVVTSSAVAMKKSPFDHGQQIVDGEIEEIETVGNRDTIRVPTPHLPFQALPVSISSSELVGFQRSLDRMTRCETVDLLPPRSAINLCTTRTKTMLVEDGPVKGTPPSNRRKHRNRGNKRSRINEGCKAAIPKMTPPLKNTCLSTPEKENPVFCISSASSISFGSSLETVTPGSFSPVTSVTSKTYGPNVMPTSVDRSINVEHVDATNCVLLPDLHEQPAMPPSDQVGLAHVDGNNTVYIYMPLNGP